MVLQLLLQQTWHHRQNLHHACTAQTKLKVCVLLSRLLFSTGNGSAVTLIACTVVQVNTDLVSATFEVNGATLHM